MGSEISHWKLIKMTWSDLAKIRKRQEGSKEKESANY